MSSFARRNASAVANAEIKVFNELQRRGLNKFLETQRVFSFFWQTEGIHATIIDYYWQPPINLAVFLDGPPHLKQNQEVKDEKVDDALKRRGIRVLRISYKPPTTKKGITEIVDQIEKEVKKV